MGWGDNLVAVEIHQDVGNSSDISFDLMIWGEGAAGPTLTIDHVDATHATISWPFPSTGYLLEFKTDLNAATWTLSTDADVPDASFHHVTVNSASGKKFFRLRKP